MARNLSQRQRAAQQLRSLKRKHRNPDSKRATYGPKPMTEEQLLAGLQDVIPMSQRLR